MTDDYYYDFTYDAVNNITGVVVNNNSVHYQYTYDLANRMTDSTHRIRYDQYPDYELHYSIDNLNNITLERLTIRDDPEDRPKSESYETLYSYDMSNKLSAIKLPFENEDHEFKYFYDYAEDGNLFHVLYPAYDTWYALNRYIHYDRDGRCIGISDNGFGTGPDANSFYEYNANGNVIKPVSWAGTDTYGYDSQDRLTSWNFDAKSGSDISETYNYDLAGNLTNKAGTTYTVDKANQIINDGSHNFVYNANGNLTSDGQYTYSYDRKNRLQAVSVGGQYPICIDYDYRGFRTSKSRVNNFSTKYICDDHGNIIYQFRNVLGNEDGIESFFYYSPEGKIIGMTINGTTYATHENLRGDIISLTDVMTGDIVAKYEYDSWGNVIRHEGDVDSPFRYAGYYYDEEMGLYYCKSRYYSPRLGRFLTKDSVDYIDIRYPEAINCYTYADNNPINYVDPTGHFVFVIGAVAVAPEAAAAVAALGTAAVCGTIGLGKELWDRFWAEDDSISIPDMPKTPGDVPPGKEWEWRGKGKPGSKEGNWYNKKTGESLHPDLGHPLPEGPHWDYREPNGGPWWRLFPDGRKLNK